MTEPSADRPYMPGYGILGPDEGTGLLPWSWAEEIGVLDGDARHQRRGSSSSEHELMQKR